MDRITLKRSSGSPKNLPIQIRFRTEFNGAGGRSLLAGDFHLLNRLQAGAYLQEQWGSF
jgi:hypothetical protein